MKVVVRRRFGFSKVLGSCRSVEIGRTMYDIWSAKNPKSVPKTGAKIVDSGMKTIEVLKKV